MNKINLRGIIVSVILILSLSFTVFADTQSELNKAVDEKDKIQKDIDASKDKKAAAEKEKTQIDENVNKLSDQLEEINKSLNSLNTKKDAINKQLEEAYEKEEKQEELLKKRLRVMYEDGAISYFSILMSSDSIFDFFYNLEMLRQISEYDNKVLEELKETKAAIEKSKAELDAVIAEETSKKNELKAAEAKLKAESDKKVAYMKELEKDIESYKKKLDEIEKQEAQLRAEIARQMQGQSGSNVPKSFVGGTFAWPAPGVTYITSQYGYRTHPTTKQYKLHTGVDIGAPSGTSVVAAADGVVTISGNHTAYGKYISINHGGGVGTLYAHNSQLLVSVGESVKKGQVIAKSGNTGWSTGPHLHFEVLINGSPVNPMQYFN